MDKTEIEEILNQNLAPGSSNREIIALFENQGWVYVFDEHQSRYQARAPEEDNNSIFSGRNQIYIYVNSDMSFLKADVEKVYSGL